MAFNDGSIVEYSDSNNILAFSTTSDISSHPLLPDWVKGGVNATLFLHNMSKPRHGKLQVDTDGT